MKLASVQVARYLAIVELSDLNPQGAVHFVDLVPALVQKCGFAQYPQKFEDLDREKGFVFDGGKLGSVNNVRLHVFNFGFALDTISSTDDSKRALETLLSWAAEKFRLNYRPEMIKRQAFYSELVFYSDVNLSSLNEALRAISTRLTKRVSELFGLPLEYSPTALFLGYDSTYIKNGPSAFTIERRVDTPFSDGKHFSRAPLPTNEHMKLLEELESLIKPPAKK